VLAGLARRRDWVLRAGAEAGRLPGRLPGAAVRLLAEESLVSANLLRDRLGVSQQAANQVLRRLAALGLAEEISGQRRFRVWRARGAGGEGGAPGSGRPGRLSSAARH
jgi:predicted ArsR family transcriptional regulator